MKGATQQQPMRVLKWLHKAPPDATALQLVREGDLESAMVQTAPPPTGAQLTGSYVEGFFAAAQDDCDAQEDSCAYSLRFVGAAGVLSETSIGRFVPSDSSHLATLDSPPGTAQSMFADLLTRSMADSRAQNRQHHQGMANLLRLYQQRAAEDSETIKELRKQNQEMWAMLTARPLPANAAESEARAVAIDKFTDAAIEALKPALPRIAERVTDAVMGTDSTKPGLRLAKGKD